MVVVSDALLGVTDNSVVVLSLLSFSLSNSSVSTVLQQV